MAFQVTFGKGGVSTSQIGGVNKSTLEEAQRSGKLNLVARGLEEISEEILNINEHKQSQETLSFDQMDKDMMWYEKVPVTKLMLNSNSIKQIPDGISKLVPLVSLECGANEISQISGEIGKLTNLAILSLSSNLLTTLPPQMCALTQLTSLKLDSNRISQLGDWVGDLVNINTLTLRDNRLESLPASIGNLSALTKLDLSHNQLTGMPEQIGKLDKLTELLCYKNKLASVPDLSGLASLCLLDISLNTIQEFPKLPGGSTLQEVNLAVNRISSIPEESLIHMKGLVTLQISENQLSTLPDAITSLAQLQRLDCSGNNLVQVPYTLGHMQLTQLGLQGNLLKDLRPEMLTKSTGELLSYLVSKIPNEDTDALGATPLRPEEHPLMQYIHDKRVVRLNGKGWEELPPELMTSLLCPEVKEVDLSKNKLSSIPEEFFQSVGQTEGLQLQFNRLSRLPLGVCALTSLTLLQLFNNKLKELPQELVQLSSLLDIRIGFNQFSELPKVLFQIPSLMAIIADNNDIERVDAVSLQQLPNLSALDLSNNSIKQLPPKLALCPALRSLLVQGNLFKVPGNQVLDQGSATLLDWLRGRIPQ